jgi:hypothetical protein
MTRGRWALGIERPVKRAWKRQTRGTMSKQTTSERWTVEDRTAESLPKIWNSDRSAAYTFFASSLGTWPYVLPET